MSQQCTLTAHNLEERLDVVASSTIMLNLKEYAPVLRCTRPAIRGR